MTDIPFRSKEVSWLSFNSRVLQEAQSSEVPLLERLKFLGIYSSNLDEFFRVRVATLRRMQKLKIPFQKIGVPDPAKTLKEVSSILKKETDIFNRTYAQVFKELDKEGIRLITDKQVADELKDYVNDYLENTVMPRLMPIVIGPDSKLSGLKDKPMYLAVRMTKKSGAKTVAMHALIDIPNDVPRFHVLPKVDEVQRVMYLDDVIRFGLHKVFEGTSYENFESYALKFTRDAELELDNDFTESFFEQVSEGLKAREEGLPVRVNYDEEMPTKFLRLVTRGLDITGDDDSEFPGARYHNRKDLMKFPTFGRKDLLYKPLVPSPHPRIDESDYRGLMRRIRSRDLLFHFPYQSFNHFLDLLRQACLDPQVKGIAMTQYRLAQNSCVARALMTASTNGKEVTVMVEPTARFDEQANIRWASLYKDAGVNVILGVPGLKVHTKLCLIERQERQQIRYYSCVSTGNFNEDTATLYTDHMLMTYNQEIGEDLKKIFQFFLRNYDTPKLEHLICAPFDLRSKVREMVQREIDYAEEGEPAEISIKINNLSDLEAVGWLYDASRAGVKVRLIVRSMFSVRMEEKGHSDNIEAIGIVDQLLEHTRILIFNNGGNRRYYISSADFLPRNFDTRCESLCPIYDKVAQRELQDYFDIQWENQLKARWLDRDLKNELRAVVDGIEPQRAQAVIQEYLRNLTTGQNIDEGR